MRIALTPSEWRWLGNGLILLGVLVWAPFLIAMAMGEDWPFLPFLAAHLTGVLGGWQLRARAATMEGSASTAWEIGRRRRWLSRLLIYLGVLAWAPYFYQTRVLGHEVEIFPYLAAHLTGVLSGVALRLSVEMERRWRRSGRLHGA
ncbi:hypothetical protein [Thermoflexus sp.]|uniref:hypothetical protein n=1 Tax=Thermoflexus sp. TaxID=1969742 RepID=UPI0035E4092C